MGAIQPFAFLPTAIKGVLQINAFCAEDSRGCLTKDYSKDVFLVNGHPFELKEVFYTTSYKGVIRAIHFQREVQQGKLIRVIKGCVYDVVVDLRDGSETFGKWQSFKLCEDEKKELYIPGGCGHGYLVLEDSIVSYKADNPYIKEFDDGIMWNDPDINVAWPLNLAAVQQGLPHEIPQTTKFRLLTVVIFQLNNLEALASDPVEQL